MYRQSAGDAKADWLRRATANLKLISSGLPLNKWSPGTLARFFVFKEGRLTMPAGWVDGLYCTGKSTSDVGGCYVEEPCYTEKNPSLTYPSTLGRFAWCARRSTSEDKGILLPGEEPSFEEENDADHEFEAYVSRAMINMEPER